MDSSDPQEIVLSRHEEGCYWCSTNMARVYSYFKNINFAAMLEDCLNTNSLKCPLNGFDFILESARVLREYENIRVERSSRIDYQIHTGRGFKQIDGRGGRGGFKGKKWIQTDVEDEKKDNTGNTPDGTVSPNKRRGNNIKYRNSWNDDASVVSSNKNSRGRGGRGRARGGQGTGRGGQGRGYGN